MSQDRNKADFEELLAACIEGCQSRGEDAVEEVLREHPEEAPRLRKRLDSLRDLGLLEGTDEAAEERSFGPYRLLRAIGTGGMGVVYLAREEKSGKHVALKACRFAFDPNGHTRARFEREIRAVSALEHPSIIRIHDYGEVDGRPYYTMDLVEGATLASVISELRSLALSYDALHPEHLRQCVLRPARLQSDAEHAIKPSGEREKWGHTYVECVCRIMLDVADGLDHAHKNSIVHRDINPSNIFLQPNGRALVFDLGLAHISNQPALTRTGEFAGTPHYASPEQIESRTGGIDQRTDVYSMGVTLYELLSLCRPFEGRSTADLLESIRTREAPLLRRLNPHLPRDLETICATAMQKDPAHRYPTMEALAADLRRFLHFQPIEARPLHAGQRLWRTMLRRKARALLVGSLAAVIIGWPILLTWSNASIRAQRSRADANAHEAQRAANQSAAVTEHLVSAFDLGSSLQDGSTVTARKLLDDSARNLDVKYREQPLIAASLMVATGRAYARLGLYAEAVPLFDRAFARRQRELGEAHSDTAEILERLAGAHLELGHTADAEALARRSLAAHTAASSHAGESAARAHAHLGRCLQKRAELALAEEAFERALELLRNLATAEPFDPGRFAALDARVSALAWQDGRVALARARSTAAIANQRLAWTPDPHTLAAMLEAHANMIDAEQSLADSAAAMRVEAQELRGGAPPIAAIIEPAAFTRDEDAFPIQLIPEWKEEYDAQFQAGITALQSTRPADAVRAFEGCHALDPLQPISAFNLCCALTMGGDLDRAMQWLEVSIELGLAASEERMSAALRDPELADLHDHPRWDACVERMRYLRAECERRVDEPFIQRGSADQMRGMLVVLHDAGAFHRQSIDATWLRLAEEFDLILVAPSGRFVTVSEGATDMRWFEDLSAYLQRPASLSRALAQRVTNWRQQEGAQDLPLWVAGVGDGALVAFDLALRFPDLVDAVMLADGAPHPVIATPRAQTAIAAGLRIRLVDAQEQQAGLLASWLRAQSFDAEERASAREVLVELMD